MYSTVFRARLAAALFLLAFAFPSQGAQLAIDLGAPRALETDALLARPDAAAVAVPKDAIYKRAMTYRAVPLRALLSLDSLPPGAMLQFVAADGFVANLPAALIFPANGQGAFPWLAIEPADAPWPRTDKGEATGSFALVWTNPEASGVSQEQWPYAVVEIRLAAAPAERWPQIAAGADAPEKARRGEKLVATHCMVCHKVDGGGDSAIGPDLVRPHSPTEYLQPWALKALIRDPGSVRNWPERRMPGFAADALGDDDVDAVAAYLSLLAARRN